MAQIILCENLLIKSDELRDDFHNPMTSASNVKYHDSGGKPEAGPSSKSSDYYTLKLQTNNQNQLRPNKRSERSSTFYAANDANPNRSSNGQNDNIPHGTNYENVIKIKKLINYFRFAKINLISLSHDLASKGGAFFVVVFWGVKVRV